MEELKPLSEEDLNEAQNLSEELFSNSGDSQAQLLAVKSLRLIAEVRQSRQDSAWPPRDVVAALVQAVGHLFRDHNCDQTGYETWLAAREAAQEWLAPVEKEQE